MRSASARDALPDGEPETPSSSAPAATIAIITRDRKNELRDAVRSALQQEGSFEVLVVDDGSQDGTLEMLRQEFPEVRVARYDDDSDVAVRRNDVAALANGEVIVTIDDDAVFSSPRIVADTLSVFNHPRIAAVAIPYIDIGDDTVVHQRAPDSVEQWVTTIFRATAYGIRRDVLLQLGGYSPDIPNYGEEWDLSMRMLKAGYVIRLGRSEPIHHHASPKRSFSRMDRYSRRSEVIISWRYLPSPWNIIYMVGFAIKGLSEGVRVGRPWNMLVGIAMGLRACASAPGHRAPIPRAAFQLDQLARSRVRRKSGVRLTEAEARLGPIGAISADADTPRRPVQRGVATPLRGTLATLVRFLGRPVRCEVCGEVLFRGLPFIWKGKLKLLGAENALVRADWDKMNRLTLRHVERHQCKRR